MTQTRLQLKRRVDDPRSQGRQRNAAARVSTGGVEVELTQLATLSLEELRAEWKSRFQADPPAIRSRDLLCQLIAWQLQADAFGDLDKKIKRALGGIAERLERDGAYEPKLRRDLAPGVELAREWKGAVHKVTVTSDGFQYLGRRYASLSDIARTITGTRWSGPRFFGLEQKRKRKTAEQWANSISTGESA